VDAPLTGVAIDDSSFVEPDRSITAGGQSVTSCTASYPLAGWLVIHLTNG
jgi:hypothetical protein